MAFKTRHDNYKYYIIIFELAYCLLRFKNYIKKILTKKSDAFKIIYLNNILFYNFKKYNMNFF